MSTVLSVIALAGTVTGAFMWVVSTLRHRSHISQCAQDLQRHRRLDKRLIGCVSEMERILDTTAVQAPGVAAVPEELVGNARYLVGLRQEAADHAADLSRHAVRLRWPDGYLAKTTLAGRRCELAHGALVNAFQALADATREYERGLATALLFSGDGAEARTMSMPVRLLDDSAALEVARLREVCAQALTHATTARLDLWAGRASVRNLCSTWTPSRAHRRAKDAATRGTSPPRHPVLSPGPATAHGCQPRPLRSGHASR